MLDDRQRTLYARHLLLPEIGAAGQAALCAAVVSVRGGADPVALAAARDYLERAGVQVVEDAGAAVELSLPTTSDLARVPAVAREAAAMAAGAFAAVEAIKRIVGTGAEGSLDLELFG